MLDVSCCNRITNAGLSWVAKLSKLTALHLAGTKTRPMTAVTEDGECRHACFCVFLPMPFSFYMQGGNCVRVAGRFPLDVAPARL